MLQIRSGSDMLYPQYGKRLTMNCFASASQQLAERVDLTWLKYDSWALKM